MRKVKAGLVILFLCATLGWATQKPPAASSVAAAQLRQEYYAQDFSRVVQDGQAMLERYPNDLELRAWYVVANAREGGVLGEELTGRGNLNAVVSGMKQSAPDSPWTLLATAAAGNDFQEEIALCEKAIAGDRSNPDILVLAAAVLAQAMWSEEDSGPVKQFLAKHKAEYERSANGLAAEAQAFEAITRNEQNAGSAATAEAAASAEAADRALARDPDNVAALLLKSQALQKARNYRANYDLLEKAAEAVLDSYALHEAYWRAVLARPNTSPAEREREILGDAARISSAYKPPADIVQMALFELNNGSPSVAKALGDLLVKQCPNSSVEDAVVLSRATASEVETEDQRDAEVSALEAFIDRPKHYDSGLLSEANRELVEDMLDQEHPDLERLYRAEFGSAGTTGGILPGGVVVLADHKFHLREIENLADSQLHAQWGQMHRITEGTPAAHLKSMVQVTLRIGPAGWSDALGWVEFQEGRTDAALPNLEIASQLRPQDPKIAVHLGRVYEAKSENSKAERTFADALSMQYSGEGDHPAIAALRQLYVHTHGGEKGLEAYMQPILAKDAARRQAAVLTGRLTPEKAMKAFELATLDGKEVSSEGLKGKYLVLNFWATW